MVFPSRTAFCASLAFQWSYCHWLSPCLAPREQSHPHDAVKNRHDLEFVQAHFTFYGLGNFSHLIPIQYFTNFELYVIDPWLDLFNFPFFQIGNNRFGMVSNSQLVHQFLNLFFLDLPILHPVEFFEL